MHLQKEKQLVLYSNKFDVKLVHSVITKPTLEKAQN